jgi:ubiquitin C-terminal hydrolase
MMLIINKSEPQTKLITTCSEINPVTTGSTLEVFNLASNVTNTYSLPNDTSEYPERYNLFEVATSTFSGLTQGHYKFKIKDSQSATTESGLLRVITEIQTPDEKIESEFVFIKSNETEDDYIIYE